VELADVRRVLLGGTRYYLYYRHNEDESAVDILAVWHTRRGTPPEF
jgi:plasmid stabilization system protein ParE